MRSVILALGFASMALAPAVADGTNDYKQRPAHRPAQVSLPPPQPGVVVTIERGVRVWRPVSSPVEATGDYPQAAAAQPYAAPPQAPSNNGYGGGYGVYGGDRAGTNLGARGLSPYSPYVGTPDQPRSGAPDGPARQRFAMAPLPRPGHAGKPANPVVVVGPPVVVARPVKPVLYPPKFVMPRPHPVPSVHAPVAYRPAYVPPARPVVKANQRPMGHGGHHH